ncbi:MAG: Gfo/Idh/MocA family oxidoreductase [Candidatus Fermentibacteraceae bacterium]|nr:Gfo/Idh/MocA family oxidoreductase [Candidatus Fermentibacteraceae bacterium]MBN2607670.1 Gfo/Idh/MocA family oxidoreductase [Candidatus Fermentibacteraceae bacterium]
MVTGVIGTGHLGYHHARILGGLTGSTVPIFDTDVDRMEQLSLELDVRPCHGLDQLFEQCDSVVVATNTSNHHQSVMKALEAGVHVLVEKPIASSTTQAREMVEMAEDTNLVLAVGHVERFNPAILAASDLIDNPLFVEGHRMAPFNPRGTDVSVVLDLMIHDIDLVLSFVRSPVASVQASGIPVLSGNVDIASARIQFENRCVVNMTASRISRERIRKLRFFQPRMYVAVDFASREVEAYQLVGESIQPIEVRVPEVDALTEELKDFRKACSTGCSPTVSGIDGLNALVSAQIISGKINESAEAATGQSS